MDIWYGGMPLLLKRLWLRFLCYVLLYCGNIYIFENFSVFLKLKNY